MQRGKFTICRDGWSIKREDSRNPLAATWPGACIITRNTRSTKIRSDVGRNRLLLMNPRLASWLPASMASATASKPARRSGEATNGPGSTMTMAATQCGWDAANCRTARPPGCDRQPPPCRDQAGRSGTRCRPRRLQSGTVCSACRSLRGRADLPTQTDAAWQSVRPAAQRTIDRRSNHERTPCSALPHHGRRRRVLFRAFNHRHRRPPFSDTDGLKAVGTAGWNES